MAGSAHTPVPACHIEIIEPDPEDCSLSSLPPEGNVKLRNYRVLSENLRSYTPTGDINTSPTKGKLVSKFDICSTISVPRERILELLRPEDPGREALEAIVRPAPRRGLARPFDDDTRRFLQRALLSPQPQGFSNAATPEPYCFGPETNDSDRCTSHSHYGDTRTESRADNSDKETEGWNAANREQNCFIPDNERCISVSSYNFPHKDCEREKGTDTDKQRSLADELREAEEQESNGGSSRKELNWHAGDMREAFERERLGKLALSVEEDEGECDGLTLAARKLDALLAESHVLHAELAGIHQDMQAACARAGRCVSAARALAAESRALRYLDDVVALLRGDERRAARGWPFAAGARESGRNYVV